MMKLEPLLEKARRCSQCMDKEKIRRLEEMELNILRNMEQTPPACSVSDKDHERVNQAIRETFHRFTKRYKA